MPDGVIHPVSVASASPFVLPPPSRPSELIAAVIAAVTPLLDTEGFELKKGLGHADVATALKPVAGAFTIADAVTIAEALDSASCRSDMTSLPSRALAETFFTLRQFIFSGLASSREDVAAREAYIGAADAAIPQHGRLLLSKALQFDIQALLDGDYSSGQLFGGDQPSLTSDFNPTPWWKQREWYLSELKVEE